MISIIVMMMMIVISMTIGVEANLCSLLPGVSCKPNPVRQLVTFQVANISMTMTRTRMMCMTRFTHSPPPGPDCQITHSSK